jgi:mRNA interferase YafQ
MYRPSFTGQFKQDRKKARKRGADIGHLDRVLATLIEGKPLDARYRPHTLSGRYNKHWECHVEPDFLLIWHYAPNQEIVFVRTGTHADLF